MIDCNAAYFATGTHPRHLGLLCLLLSLFTQISSEPQELGPSTSGWRALIEGAAPASTFILLPGHYAWGLDGGCNILLPDGVSIAASQQGTAVIDCTGANPSKHFTVRSDMGATIDGLVLLNGSTTGNGGCIEVGVGGSLRLRQTVFKNCSAQGSGGALYLAVNSSLELDAVVITSAFATEHGGAIYFGPDSVAEAHNISFQQTVATENGGAVYSEDATVSMTRGVEVVECRASRGGALYATEGSSINLQDATIRRNVADGDYFVCAAVYSSAHCSAMRYACVALQNIHLCLLGP